MNPIHDSTHEAAAYAFKKYYGKSFAILWRTNNELKASNRMIHGILHAVGCASLIREIDELYRNHVSGYSDMMQTIASAFQLSQEEVLTLIEIAAVFHDSGRKADGVDYWDVSSSKNLYAYLIKQNTPQNLAKLIQLTVAFKDNPQHFLEHSTKIQELKTLDLRYLRHLINMADTLEVIRARGVFHCKYFPIYSDLSTDKLLDKNQLKKDVLMLIKNTANRINMWCYDGYDEHIVVDIDSNETRIIHQPYNGWSEDNHERVFLNLIHGYEAIYGINPHLDTNASWATHMAKKLENIIKNISDSKNRFTNRSRHPKITMLSSFKNWLILNQNDGLFENTVSQEHILDLIKTICSIKRHSLNVFWRPESLNELRTPTRQRGLNLTHHDSFTKTINKALLSNDIDLLDEQIRLLITKPRQNYDNTLGSVDRYQP
jgi:hypothetical protein